MTYQVDRKLFDKYLQNCFEMAQEYMAQNPLEETIPKLIVAVQEDDGWVITLCGLLEFNENHYRVMRQLGMRFGLAQDQVAAIFLVTEGWVSTIPKEEYEAHPENRLPPSEDPDRQEALLVFGKTIDLHTDQITALIERDEKGKATLGERFDQEADDFQTPLLDQFLMGYAVAYLSGGSRRN